MLAFTVLEGPGLPAEVRLLPNAPTRLYLRGALPRAPRVAIVGTRAATPGGLDFARELAAELSATGVTVVSGGAVGIDAAAHRGALDRGAPTLVVAPSPLERAYPPEHAGLFDEVCAAGGGVVTAEEAGAPAFPPRFFRRNSLLVALSSAVVVVESRFRGGARNAASWARRLSRPLFAVPGAPWVPEAGGCLEELRLGARMLRTAADLRSVLDRSTLPPVSRPAAPRRLPDGLPGEARRLAERLLAGPADADTLCADTGLGAPVVQAMLLTLTLSGVVVSDPGGRWTLANC